MTQVLTLDDIANQGDTLATFLWLAVLFALFTIAGGICGTDVGIYHSKDSLRNSMAGIAEEGVVTGHEFCGAIAGAGPKAAAVLAAVALVTLVGVAPFGQASRFSDQFFARLAWRNLGPFRTGAWTTAIGVPETPVNAHLYTFYVGTRNGGVWKTTNNGTTFEPVFDGQDVTGIGCLAVAPSNENIVWVGTGDASSVRVTYPGDGVYKDRVDWGVNMEMSGPTSGSQAIWVKGFQDYMRKVNEAGGVHGRKINVLAEDSRYNAATDQLEHLDRCLVFNAEIALFSNIGIDSWTATRSGRVFGATVMSGSIWRKGLMPFITRLTQPGARFLVHALQFSPLGPKWFVGRYCTAK